MNIALFFGSFNPIHSGHLIIANQILDNIDLDELWFVVSPQNPFKKKEELIDASHRIEMLELATAYDHRLKVSSIELTLPQPSYTVTTLKTLSDSYSKDTTFSLVMGGDNLHFFSKWKDYQYILSNHHIYAYDRPGFTKSDFHDHNSITVVKGPLLNISATQIRNYISDRKSTRYLIDESVKKYIQKNNLYK